MNVGIILPSLGPSQLTEEVLEAIQKGKDRYCLYYENLMQHYRPIPFPVMNISESVYFSGKLIATSLFSASYILSNLNHTRKLLFCNDLEFLRGRTDFMQNISVYRNPELELYTRSEDYAKLLSNYTNKEVKVKTIEELIYDN